MNRTGSKRLGIIFLLSLWMGLLACYSSPRVIISTKSGRELVLKVEVADTPAKRELGLQYRRELGEDQGMLFLFPFEGVQSFWMKNTPLPRYDLYRQRLEDSRDYSPGCPFLDNFAIRI